MRFSYSIKNSDKPCRPIGPDFVRQAGFLPNWTTHLNDRSRCRPVIKTGSTICPKYPDQRPSTFTSRGWAGAVADFWAFDSMRPPPQPISCRSPAPAASHPKAGTPIASANNPRLTHVNTHGIYVKQPSSPNTVSATSYQTDSGLSNSARSLSLNSGCLRPTEPLYMLSASAALRSCSARMRSSIVPYATNFTSHTLCVWPMRWARSVAWFSTAGFHQGS